MEDVQQDELKRDLKEWLKKNNRDYAWLASKCLVSELTVRNWMARKLIPTAKANLIRTMIKQVDIILPAPRVQVTERTVISLELDADTKQALERQAFSQGKTLAEFLADMVAHKAGKPSK